MHPISPEIFRTKLQDHYAQEICHLKWDRDKPYTLIFAVILSAQCTDKRVNAVTPRLFKAFPDLESFAVRPIEALESVIRSCGYYHAKARHIQGCAQGLLEHHQGIIPQTMEALTALPGLGRKSANVILWNVFGKNLGFVVDTHIGRIARRTGLTLHQSPLKVEKDLMAKLPQDQWGKMSHQLVQFGRDFCKARNPKCESCFFKKECPRRGV